MKTYKLIYSGGSKIATALCARCQMGKAGENFLRSGGSQEAMALLAAKIAIAYSKAGRTEQDIAAALEDVSACNASAAKQALAKVDIISEELALAHFGKDKAKDKAGNVLPVAVATFWESIGGAVRSPSLAMLDV